MYLEQFERDGHQGFYVGRVHAHQGGFDQKPVPALMAIDYHLCAGRVQPGLAHASEFDSDIQRDFMDACFEVFETQLENIISHPVFLDKLVLWAVDATDSAADFSCNLHIPIGLPSTSIVLNKASLFQMIELDLKKDVSFASNLDLLNVIRSAGFCQEDLLALAIQ